MLPNSDTFMDMLKNKDKVIVSILKDLEVCDKNMQSFDKLCLLFDEGKEVNTEKALTACAKSLKHMNDVNRRLLMMMMVYVAGNNYTSDAGHVLVKMGRGQEALQELFRRKMKGHG